MFQNSRTLVAKTVAVLAMAAAPLLVGGVATADSIVVNGANGANGANGQNGQDGQDGQSVCVVSINGETQTGTGDECDELLASIDFDLPDLPDFGDYELPNFGDFELPDFGGYQVPDFGDFELPDLGDYQVPDFGDYELPDFPQSSGSSSTTVTSVNGETVCAVSINGETQTGTGDECDDLLASVPSYGPLGLSW